MAITVSKINYAGWPNCFRIADEIVELIVTTDIGPRIIRLGFKDEPNLFGESPDQVGQIGGDTWKIYGGHRLWHSPESRSRTYYPDNSPVQVSVMENGLQVRQPVESNTGIEKEIILTVAENTHRITVEHRLSNRGIWPVSFAPWALSAMNTDGVAIVPQYRQPDIEGLLPNRIMSLWPYTDMNDPRVTWGSRYILVKQDPKNSNPFKFGLSVPEGWMAYALNGNLFIKRFNYSPGQTYPDGGVNIELYTDHRFLELETIGLLQTVPSGATITHTEVWSIYKGIGGITTESDIEQKVASLVGMDLIR
jgi:hypothetical protein